MFGFYRPAVVRRAMGAYIVGKRCRPGGGLMRSGDRARFRRPARKQNQANDGRGGAMNRSGSLFSVRVFLPSLAVAVSVGPGTVGAADDLLATAAGQVGLARWTCYHAPAVESVGQVWKLEGGVLTCRGLPKGYLSTKETYTDFVLKLQWRWPPGSRPGHGGVLFRMTGEHKIWPRSLEAQLNAGSEGDLIGLAGYRLSGPPERMKVIEHKQFGRLTFVRKTTAAAKPPGQWNEITIEARGGRVSVWLNSRKVNEATDCDVIAGPILLTAEGEPIQFRKIELTPLR
ncbi:MAG TPA: DUF1080 domain-containing protein, partial [Planctomycetaceae bacterium]|nr:DUF1080 domain-containing protein [Planctomycetaceae bacterium]